MSTHSTQQSFMPHSKLDHQVYRQLIGKPTRTFSQQRFSLHTGKQHLLLDRRTNIIMNDNDVCDFHSLSKCINASFKDVTLLDLRSK